MAGPEFPSCQPLPQLPTGGYDDDYFVDPAPKSLHCPVCLLVLREPHLISCCGTHICQVCIERVQANEQSCPCCRSENYINVLNKEKRGKVLELKVRCVNSAKGCDWVGELGDEGRHCTSRCQYVEAVCQYGCGESYPRFMLNKHEQDECPKRPIDMKMATFTRQMMEKVSSLETKYEREITALKKKLKDQEERHIMEKKEFEMLQKITEKDKKEVLQQLAVHKNCDKDMREELIALQKSVKTLKYQVEQGENKRKALEEKLENEKQQMQKKRREQQHLNDEYEIEVVEISQLEKETSDLKGCPICLMEPLTDPVVTKCCEEQFCKKCIEQAMVHSPYCPICKTPLRPVEGNQPHGSTMNHYTSPFPLPGYPNCDTITIKYFVPHGTQGPEHPNPGHRYQGTARTAYLPDNPEGREVLKLLKKAFQARLIFTVGTSTTSGQSNTVVWNCIHHKTNTHGGLSGHGYPDPTYLHRVKEELNAKGIH